MAKYNATVMIQLSIDYGWGDDPIEADDEEEAMKIAQDRALEDIDFNNAEMVGNPIVTVWEDDE